MKKLLLVSILSLLSFTQAFSQFFNVSHLTGTQLINGVNVTVTFSGSATSTPWCGVNPYWIGSGGPGTYTFTFSQPVYAVRAEVTAMNDGELNTFDINGAPYPLTPPNVSVYLGNCNQNQAVIAFGGLFGPAGTPGTPGVGGQVDIEDCNGITSCSITNNGVLAGTTFSFYFDATPGGGGITVNAGSNSPICVGQTINLTASNVSGGAYTWTGPLGFNSNQQNPSITGATENMSGDYIVSAVGACGPDTDTVNVQVLPLPVIASTTISNPTTCGGSDGSITLTGLQPNGIFTVNYTVNGNPMTLLNVAADASGNLIINGLTQGTYTNVTVTNAAGCASGPTSGTLVDPPVPAAPIIASNSPVCENGTITLTANSIPGATYSWSGPGFVSSLQNPSITNAQMTSEGNYTATITVANCVSPGTTIFVDMTPLPAPPVVANIDYCQYDIAVPLTATGSSLLWYTSQTGTGSSVAPTPNTGTPGVTTYWVTQTVSSCEGPMSPINVTVKPQPTAPVYTGPTHYCRDEPTTPLTANGQALQWYDNNNNPLAGAPTVTTVVPADYVYYVTQTINGCESPKTTVNVHVADIPPAPGVSDITYCQYDVPVALTANGTGLQWFNSQFGGTALIATPIPTTNVPNTRTWFVSQTVDGCESPRAPITVTTLFLPTSTFAASRPLVCENDTLTFYYTGDGTNAELYTWTLPNDSTVLISGNTNTPGPIVIRFDSIGTFPLTLNVNNQGCNTTFVYNVKVVVVPDVEISMQNNICIHDTAKIGLGDYNSPLATYIWDFDGGTNLYSDVNEGPYQVTWAGTGLHYVHVTVGNTACEATFSDTVLIHNLPDAHFAAALTGSGICVGDSLRLTAVDNKAIYSYQWAPEGFFNQSNNNAPVVNAYVRAADEISLTVTSPYGCSATEKMMIDAQQCCTVFLPNAFTPNGDGKNDIFRPVTSGNHAIKLFMIVDRWGKKVFETLDENIGWDGTFNGEDQDIGTFYYILQYKCDGKVQDMKGEVILVR
jgi:gliding motility-associated-like protein